MSSHVLKHGERVATVHMDYNIAQLLRQPTGESRDFVLNENLQGLDKMLDVTAPLQGTLHVIRTNRGALVTVNAATGLRVPCARCLEPVTIPVALSFEEEFLQTVDMVSGLPTAASREDPATLIDEHHELHLSELIREYLIMALPLRPLCRPECKGLCPQCGQNLNNGPCRCTTQQSDPRWEALKSLLDKKP